MCSTESLSISPWPVNSHTGEYLGNLSQMSSSHLDCISVPLDIALDITPLLAPIARSMVPMETPSASAKTFMRDKILHIMRKLSSINLVVRKLSLTFAAYSVMNERPKIRKNREFSKFTDMSETKKMTTEEILEIFKGEYDWKTQARMTP